MAERIGINNRNTLTHYFNITTPASGTVVTGNPFSVSLTADAPVNWAIHGGADAAQFSLNGAALSMTAKNFASPVDANANNVYDVILRATNLRGFVKYHTYAVTVTAS